MKRYSIRNYNFGLVFVSVCLSVFGIIVIGSAKESVQNNQIQGLIMGIVSMTLVSLISYEFLLRFYYVYYAAAMVLLVAVRLFGREINHAKRWLVIGPIQFQPSEVAKILLILFFAQFIMKHRERISKASVLLPAMGLLALPWYLIYKQPDMSTSIVLIVIFCSMIYIGGLSYKIIGAFLAIAVPAFLIALFLILQPEQEIIETYQQLRILAWLQPDKYENTQGYQQQNSITAIGSGQLTGKGYKNNEVGSVKNGNFISEPQTDFIMAVAGEEMGFLGCSLAVILFGIATILIIRIGMRAPDLSGTLVCAGVAAHIGFQSFANIGVATGVLPNTGLPLPFISYGSTSLVALLTEVGVVLNVGLAAGTVKQSQGGLSLDLDL